MSVNSDFLRCCKNGHLESIKLIIPNVEHISDKNNGLLSACKEGHFEIVKLLISHGANNFNKGFWWACKHGHIEIVKLLVSNGADDFNTGLWVACLNGYIELVNLMISHGARNWNVGLRGACRGGQMEIVKMMILNGANDWNCSLWIACENLHMEIVKLMIEKGADSESYECFKDDMIINLLNIGCSIEYFRSNKRFDSIITENNKVKVKLHEYLSSQFLQVPLPLDVINYCIVPYVNFVCSQVKTDTEKSHHIMKIVTELYNTSKYNM